MPDIEQRLIIKAISEGFQQITKELQDLGGAGEKVKPPPDAKNKWTELYSQLGLVKQGFGYVQQGAKFAYDQLARGSELELARSQFDNLAKSIGTTSDALLGDLNRATGGMLSNADQIASASQIISLGLADTQEGTVRLAKSVSTLGLDMQQVILTFANNSKARLDALGLSVEDVTKKTAELEAQGFKGDAFDEAVMQALEAKMTLLGDASETTAGKLKVLNATWQDTKDAFATGFSDNAAASLGAVADNSDNVSIGAQKMAGIFGGALSRTIIDFADRMGTTRLLLAKMGEAENDAAEGAANLAKEADGADRILQNYAATVEEVYTLNKDQIQVNEDTGLAMRGLTDEYRAALRVLGEHSPALDQDTRAMEEAAYASGELGNTQERLQGYLSATPQYALDAAAAIAGITAGATGATVGVGGLNSALDVAQGKATELVTPLQEIFGALDQFQQAQAASENIKATADNMQIQADKAVVLEEKLTGVYTGLQDTGAGAEDATSKVDAYITRLGEIPAEVTTTLIVNQKVGGGGAYGGGEQGYAPNAQYAAGSTGNRGNRASVGEADFDPSRKFAAGGVVPGPLGSPQVILAHGGETVIPPGQNSLVVTQNFYGSSPNTMAQARDGLLEAARSIGLTGYA